MTRFWIALFVLYLCGLVIVGYQIMTHLNQEQTTCMVSMGRTCASE